MRCRLTEAESSAVTCGHSFAPWQQLRRRLTSCFTRRIPAGEYSPAPSQPWSPFTLDSHLHFHDLLAGCDIVNMIHDRWQTLREREGVLPTHTSPQLQPGALWG